MSNPWGEITMKDTVSSDASLSFEDSFIKDTPTEIKENKYVPLDDSEQYLAGLEKKLACIQGKVLKSRENERSRLISDLIRSRKDHAIDLLKTSTQDVPHSDQFEDDDITANGRSQMTTVVDPQGTLGRMVRKCAPEHVALSNEELCELLKSDILGKVFDELHNEDENTPPDADTVPPKPSG